jgi:serine/threonine protein kinase
MELLPGGTLKDLVERNGPLAPSAAVDAILQIVAGLDAAHADGKFDATFTGMTPAQILQAFVDNGEIFTVYSARKITIDQPDVPQVPEPATMLTFGAGTALLAAHRRRQAKKAAK